MTTVFSLYASGYKISLLGILNGEAFIHKTGILVLDSRPRGADISLLRQFRGLLFDDDVLKNKGFKTPYKIKNLSPGEYVLNLNLEGHWPWQRKISIHPGSSTYIEDIILFRRNLPVNFFATQIQNIYLCPLDSKIILEDDNKLIDLKSEQEIGLGGNVSDIDLAGDSKVILNNYLLFDYKKNKYFNLQDNNISDNGRLRVYNNNLFYIRDGLRSYNINQDSDTSIVLLSDIVDYHLYNDFYFLIRREDDNYFFQIYSYRQKEVIKSIDLPGSGDYEIILSSNFSNFIYIYERNFKRIYVVNTTFKFNSYWAVVDNVNGFSPIDSNNFVYYSNSEIYTFNSPLAEKFLVGRFTSEIKSLVWHPKNYIIYSNGREINILDLKYDKQMINLVSLEAVGNLALDKMGSVLYFTGKIGNQEGLYKLFIQ